MSPPNGTVQSTLLAPASGVTVRMYNPGFGDCLLLAFRGDDGRARYMLVDCGAHHQYPGRAERLQRVAEDIALATGEHLHLVVASHEHTDHLLGFQDGRPAFDRCAVDDLWLAWTEDPGDEMAQRLKEMFGLQLRALHSAVQQLQVANAPLAGAIQAVLDFQLPEALAADGIQPGPLAYLRAKSARKLQRPEDYCRPGTAPLTLPGVTGVKVYVLGPPRSLAGIRTLEKKSELYPETVATPERESFAAAALAARGATPLGDEEREMIRRSLPFDEAFRIPEGAAAAHPDYGLFFCQAYGFTNDRAHGPEWRRIETDWLSAAGQLALDLNGKTNNTSLVLAVELGGADPRPVLLLAADAQVGNWLSWHKLAWPGEGTGGGTVTAADLLQRTALYKVGHHGSRNATLSVQGLELMTHAELVALLPVDQEWAWEEKGWEHPARSLYDRLRAQARGRVLRTDEIPSGDASPPQPPEASEAEWQAFLGRIDWDRSPERLWIQVTVPG